MSETKPETLTDAVAAMNALPDISHDDSERLRGFMRMTAAEIKAVGGVGAATMLEMIGYIRELETQLRSRVSDGGVVATVDETWAKTAAEALKDDWLLSDATPEEIDQVAAIIAKHYPAIVHPFGPCGYMYCDWPDGELRCNGLPPRRGRRSRSDHCSV